MTREEDKKPESKPTLELNRETLRILTTGQLEAVRGGIRGDTSGNPAICGGQSDCDDQHECP